MTKDYTTILPNQNKLDSQIRRNKDLKVRAKRAYGQYSTIARKGYNYQSSRDNGKYLLYEKDYKTIFLGAQENQD